MSVAAATLAALERAFADRPPPRVRALHLPVAPSAGKDAEFGALELDDGTLGLCYLLLDGTLDALATGGAAGALAGADALALARWWVAGQGGAARARLRRRQRADAPPLRPRRLRAAVGGRFDRRPRPAAGRARRHGRLLPAACEAGDGVRRAADRRRAARRARGQARGLSRHARPARAARLRQGADDEHRAAQRHARRDPLALRARARSR